MLSKRLQAIINEVLIGHSLADIGTDHGYIPNYLLKRDLVPFTIATDINKKPLSRAIKLLKENSLDKKSDFRIGNGIEVLEDGEVDQLIIAGMGGEMISKILEKDLEKSHSFSKLILQPMTQSHLLREFLKDNNFKIIQEVFVEEKETKKSRYYTIISVVPGKMGNLNDFELEFASPDLVVKNDDYKSYINFQIDQYNKRLKNMKDSNNKKTTELCLKFLKRLDYLKDLHESFKNSD